MADPRPFHLVVDGNVVPCLNTAHAVYPPVEDGFTIEAHLTQAGVQVNVVDEEGDLIDTVSIHRGDTDHQVDGMPGSNEEALENMHAALLACIEFGVPVPEVSSYLLSRAAELAYASALPRSKFLTVCMEVYDQALAATVEEAVAGEA
jgi:hypothetical protein